MLVEVVSRHGVQALIAALLIATFAASATGQSLGSWFSTTNLPTGTGSGSCVVGSALTYVYCVGGTTSSGPTTKVNYATFSSPGGVGSWTSTTSYPEPIDGMACVAYAISVVCVGGASSGGIATDNVYSAQMSGSGVGAWSAGPAYPKVDELLGCVVGGSDLYCVGGFDGSKTSNATYYASLTKSGGVGSWAKTSDYPITVNSLGCAAESGYIYCVGGLGGSKGYSDVYFAPLSGAGVGNWVKTTSYPSTVYSQSCSANSGYLYCVGGFASNGYTGAAYYAPISSSGVGAWVESTPYPSALDLESCAAFNSSLYCFGGYYSFGGYSSYEISDKVYYSPIAPTPLTTVTTSTTSTVTSTVTSNVTSTVSRAYTVTANASTVTLTATTTSVYTSIRTSAATSVSVSLSVSTTTATSTSVLTQTQTFTVAGSTQANASGPFSQMAALPAAGGFVVGAILTLLVARIRGRGGSEAETE